MKRVILHDQNYSIGGPKAVLDGIMNSYLKEKYEFVRLKQPESCGFNPIKAISFIQKYRRAINNLNADVIYICGLEYIGLLMTIAARLSNVKKVVLSVHGSHWATPDRTFRKWLLMHVVEPLEIRLADSVITVCEAAQKIIVPLQGKSNNFGVVYNSFPSPNFNLYCRDTFRNEIEAGPDKIVVTSVGRVVEDKGHWYAIDAIKKIHDDRFVFVVVGDGDYISVYKSMCSEEISEGKVILLGKRTDVNSILRGSDIFLFPTFSENHSIALLEAVNMKCCVLCTEVGGNPEIISNGKTGLLIPKMDTNAIIRGLYSLIDPDIRSKYADLAYDECREKFSVKNTYGKLDSIFSE